AGTDSQDPDRQCMRHAGFREEAGLLLRSVRLLQQESQRARSRAVSGSLQSRALQRLSAVMSNSTSDLSEGLTPTFRRATRSDVPDIVRMLDRKSTRLNSS